MDRGQRENFDLLTRYTPERLDALSADEAAIDGAIDKFMEREGPHIRGGQGRSVDETKDDARFFTWTLAVGVVALALGLVLRSCQ